MQLAAGGPQSICYEHAVADDHTVSEMASVEMIANRDPGGGGSNSYGGHGPPSGPSTEDICPLLGDLSIEEKVDRFQMGSSRRSSF